MRLLYGMTRKDLFNMSLHTLRTETPGAGRRVDMLMADFSGLEGLEQIVDNTLARLVADPRYQSRQRWADKNQFEAASFDMWFSEVIRKELGATLGKVRNKAIKRAQEAGAGSASSAVLRRTYRDQFAGNINIGGNRKRITNKKRVVPEPTGGKSGIRRRRSVSKRTKDVREYFGPDRAFILRFLEFGTDTRTAGNQVGIAGRRSGATYGNRGVMEARSFFHSLASDMELAAAQMGQRLVDWCEKVTQQEFKE